MSQVASALVCAVSAVGAGVAGTYIASEFPGRGPKYLYGMLIGTAVGAAVSGYAVVAAECNRCYAQKQVGASGPPHRLEPRFP